MSWRHMFYVARYWNHHDSHAKNQQDYVDNKSTNHSSKYGLDRLILPGSWLVTKSHLSLGDDPGNATCLEVATFWLRSESSSKSPNHISYPQTCGEDQVWPTLHCNHATSTSCIPFYSLHRSQFMSSSGIFHQRPPSCRRFAHPSSQWYISHTAHHFLTFLFLFTLWHQFSYEGSGPCPSLSLLFFQ